MRRGSDYVNDLPNDSFAEEPVSEDEGVEEEVAKNTHLMSTSRIVFMVDALSSSTLCILLLINIAVCA